MKQKKIIIGILAFLILLTAILAVLHFHTRDAVPEGALMLCYQGKTTYVELNKLPSKEITSTVVNGKGEEKEIHEQGVSVAEVLNAAGVDPAQVNNLKVTAADEFSAQLAGDEIREEGKAFLAEDGQGGMKLIVFGDSNAKRNVRDVVRLDTD